MADYVFIHGGSIATDTWNGLTVGEPVHTPDGRMGGRAWDPVLPALRARGHRVYAPTLADEHTCDLSGHIAQVAALIESHELHDLVLVAHSYGGMVLTGVADRFAERVWRLVCVDAALPDDGQSLFDVIVAGGCDPLSFEGLEAVPPYVEQLRFDAARVDALPGVYIACTESQFAAVTQLARRKVAASGNRWELAELPTGHVPMATMPEELARLLVAAAPVALARSPLRPPVSSIVTLLADASGCDRLSMSGAPCGIYQWYLSRGRRFAMAQTAKLFMNGRSQAVRLPAAFRFSGTEVFIERQGEAVVLRPKPQGWDDFFSRPSQVPGDYLADRSDRQPEDRDLF